MVYDFKLFKDTLLHDLNLKDVKVGIVWLLILIHILILNEQVLLVEQNHVPGVEKVVLELLVVNVADIVPKVESTKVAIYKARSTSEELVDEPTARDFEEDGVSFSSALVVIATATVGVVAVINKVLHHSSNGMLDEDGVQEVVMAMAMGNSVREINGIDKSVAVSVPISLVPNTSSGIRELVEPLHAIDEAILEVLHRKRIVVKVRSTTNFISYLIDVQALQLTKEGVAWLVQTKEALAFLHSVVVDILVDLEIVTPVIVLDVVMVSVGGMDVITSGIDEVIIELSSEEAKEVVGKLVKVQLAVVGLVLS